MEEIDKRLKEAELNKIHAEIDKIETEVQKIEFERQQQKKPFFRQLKFYQIIIAGVVGGIAFLSVLTTIIEPSYKRDIIKQEIKLAEQEKKIFQLQENNINILDSIRNALQKNDSLLFEISVKKVQFSEFLNKQLENFNDSVGYWGIKIASIIFQHNDSRIYPKSRKKIHEIAVFFKDIPNIEFNVVQEIPINDLDDYEFNYGNIYDTRVQIVSDLLYKYGNKDHIIYTTTTGQDSVNPYMHEILFEEKEYKKIQEIFNATKIYIKKSDNK